MNFIAGGNVVDIDETTSVLSYGDDEHEVDDDESDLGGYLSPDNQEQERQVVFFN